jgi:hypothetical protein
MRFFIKNMVCDRCKRLVMNAMDHVDIAYIKVNLGELITSQKITSGQFDYLKASLKKSGLDLLDRPDSERLENLMNTIDELIDFPETDSEKNCGDYTSIEFNQKFNSLNILFSETKCISIKKYIDERKIMKIKELLSYYELSLAEIAKIMKYSSVAQLSGKFKSFTGLTPVDFKQIRSRINYSPGCN